MIQCNCKIKALKGFVKYNRKCLWYINKDCTLKSIYYHIETDVSYTSASSMVYKPNKALSHLSKIVKKTVLGENYSKIINEASSLNKFKDSLDAGIYKLVDDSNSSYTITYSYSIPEEFSNGSFGIFIEMI